MQKQTNKELDCNTCSANAPSVIPENVDAWRLWQNVNTQWRASAFSIIGLDYSAMFQVAEVLYIDMTPDLFRKIRALEKYELERLGKKEADRNGK